ncbi:MAG TPA: CocE/NonD family hydrolase [Prolixibacteraceae bacterium]|nr:CocE/NonD family hydrolase [Prolixibacteraceae bacterium]
MKRIAVIFVFLLTMVYSYGQDITGQWNGILKVQGMQLRIVFHITKTVNGYSSTMDSPDQHAAGIPVTATTFENPKLRLEVASARIEYTGELKGKTIIGTFRQGGMEFPMELSREIIEKKTVIRPQDPAKPYPYHTEDVTFQNSRENFTLAGTLTLPKKEGRYPAVILISGSGPQNRDEELMGHKPFLVLSDYLTRQGIAVLRFDDRGVAQSKGNFKTATTVDFASDVESAVAYLKTRKEIYAGKIGLVGHSEGGIIAPMVAAKSKELRFIVLLAGTGIRGDKLLLLQQELVAKASGQSDAEIQKSKAINSEVFGMVLNSSQDDLLKEELKK